MNSKNISIASKIHSLVIMLMFISVSVMAQQPQQQQVRQDFTDEELKSFLKANANVMEIQLEIEQKMIEAIEDEGLTVEKFNAMAEAQQDPSKSVNATPEELQSFNSAAQEILKEREKVEPQVISSIEEEGIDVQTYQEILIAYQQHPQVKSKIDKLLQEQN